MRGRFDSRPLVMRRKVTATMRQTVVLGWSVQLRHSAHLFCIIAAAVIARNVANQEVLDAYGAQVMGKLYVGVAVVAGLVIALTGWFGRNKDTRRVTRGVHGAAALLMVAAFVTPQSVTAAFVAKYIAMEIAFAAMLLAFGMLLGAALGPREARKLAARVGAGGILGGLCGNLLSVAALWIGSPPLYLVAAAFAVAPVFFLPRPTASWAKRTTVFGELPRERTDVPALAPYGRWVAICTVLMVAATTLIDYQYRFGANLHYGADAKTAFFGFVGVLGGVATVIFQFVALDRLLNRLGLFGTATVMPSALILCSAAFGLAPAIGTLVLLKVVDSGANMSLQQATGSLLLAPLGPRARAVWQGRIDGLAKRGAQLAAGTFLAAFPWTPGRILPLALLVCAGWIGAIIVTRSRYVRLLTEMLGAGETDAQGLGLIDGATVRMLQAELATAAPDRAAVILDLLERAEKRAPEKILDKLLRRDPDGPGALRVIAHLTTAGDVEALTRLAKHDHPTIAKASLLALTDLEPRLAAQRSRQVLMGADQPELLRAVAAGILAGDDKHALRLCQRLARAATPLTRLAVAEALGRAGPGAPVEIGELLGELAGDADPEVARTAIAALGNHPSASTAEVALRALPRRELRGAAMRTLAAVGQPLVPRLSDELAARRSVAPVAATLCWILGRIGTADCVTALVAAFDSPLGPVRLAAAVALSSLHRRRPDLGLPLERLRELVFPELAAYGRLREAGGVSLPDTPSATLLLRTIKQRAQASLETAFRLLALMYAEDAMQGAFAAIGAREPRKKQIALELLDTLLDKELSQAISRAVGGVQVQHRPARERQAVLTTLTQDHDRFLASLANTVLLDSAREDGDRRRAAERTGESMAITLVNQILELQSLTLFGHSSAEDLAEVAGLVAVSRVSKGQVVFREGQSGDAMYVLRTGEVTLSRQGQLIEHIGPGEAFGILSILDQLPREATATASMDSTVLSLRGDDFLQLLADRPLLMHSVFRALTSSLRQQLERGGLGKRAEEWSW